MSKSSLWDLRCLQLQHCLDSLGQLFSVFKIFVWSGHWHHSPPRKMLNRISYYFYVHCCRKGLSCPVQHYSSRFLTDEELNWTGNITFMALYSLYLTLTFFICTRHLLSHTIITWWTFFPLLLWLDQWLSESHLASGKYKFRRREDNSSQSVWSPTQTKWIEDVISKFKISIW